MFPIVERGFVACMYVRVCDVIVPLIMVSWHRKESVSLAWMPTC
jgi:hypothetical protein